MKNIFTNIYKFLNNNRWFAYLFIILSFVIFVFFGMKVVFNANIADLLPNTNDNFYGDLAFKDLKVKDKIFLQFVSEDKKLNPEELSDICNEFIDSLIIRDTTSHLVDNILYQIDDDFMFNGLDYLLSHLPNWVDTNMYEKFDSVLRPEMLIKRMQNNYELIFEEGREDIMDLVQLDPTGLRFAFLADSTFSKNSTGFSIINNHFFSPDSSVARAFLSPKIHSLDSKAGTKLVKLIEDVSVEIENKYPNIEILFHGAPVQSVFNSRQIKKDLWYSVGISLLIICTFIMMCFKNKNTLLLLLVPIIYGLFFSLACVYWIQGTMSMLALGIGAIVLGVALSYVLHIITHFKYVNDPIRVIKEQAVPISVSCITTIGAFIGLIFTQSPLLKDFGVFASFALIGTTLFALIFLPLLFKPEKNEKSEKAFAVFDKINSYRLDNKKWVVALICLIACISFYTSTLVSFDFDLKNIGYHDKNVLKSQKVYSEKINKGLSSMYYATTATTLDSALYYSKLLQKDLDILEKKGIISSFSKMTELLVPTNIQLDRIGAWHNYWNENKISNVKKDIETAASIVGFKRGLFSQFEALVEADYDTSSLYDNGILPEGLSSNIVEKVNNNFMVFTSVLMPKAEKDSVNDIVASVPHSVVIDPFYYTNGLVKIIHDDFNIVLGISSLFVFIVLLFTYKNIVLAILAFLPMFLSWFIVQGIMGIFGIQFNLINIVISTFIFGIGVDYSIYIMDGLLADSIGKKDELLLCHKTAIFLSALVLITVLGSLLFAQHPAIHSIGISTLIGMLSTVIIAYSLQPFLFRMYSNTNNFKNYINKRNISENV